LGRNSAGFVGKGVVGDGWPVSEKSPRASFKRKQAANFRKRAEKKRATIRADNEHVIFGAAAACRRLVDVLGHAVFAPHAAPELGLERTFVTRLCWDSEMPHANCHCDSSNKPPTQVCCTWTC
jgi:hypothetical protein